MCASFIELVQHGSKVWFSFSGISFGGGGGGGRKRLGARTHITSAKPDVPYGWGAPIALPSKSATVAVQLWCNNGTEYWKHNSPRLSIIKSGCFVSFRYILNTYLPLYSHGSDHKPFVISKPCMARSSPLATDMVLRLPRPHMLWTSSKLILWIIELRVIIQCLIEQLIINI